VNGAATQFLYDGLDIAQQLEAQRTTSYLRSLAIDETLGLSNPEGTFFLTADALGSTVAVRDPSGSAVTEYTYDTFGSVSTTNPAFPNPFQFTGRENDGLAGLYYYRARYYHPGLQRFVSEDPIGLPGGINAYAYVRNSPLRFTDPRGLQVPCYPGPLMGPECSNPDSDRTPGCDAACQRDWIERNQEPLADIFLNLLCAVGKIHCGAPVPGLPPYPSRPTPGGALLRGLPLFPFGADPAEAVGLAKPEPKTKTSGRKDF